MNIKTLVTRQYGTNCYLLEGENCAIVIDPGEAEPELLKFCEEQKEKKNKLILLTHCHFDHIGGVEEVKKIWDCPVLIGENEAEGLSDNRINLSGYGTQIIYRINPDKTLSDGEIIECGEYRIEVLSTPGHTAGSVCYLLGETLFSGDTLFRLSVGRTDLPTGDFPSLKVSLRRLSGLNKNTTVLAGHGPSTVMEYEIENNPYIR